MKILFWNTHKNPNINLVLGELITEHDISIAILAEYDADIDALLATLRQKQGIMMQSYVTLGCDKIKIIGTIADVIPGIQLNRASIQIISNDLILCCVHLQSQIYNDSRQYREISIGQIIEEIRIKETELNTSNTIVVGDFNIDPYDESCVGASFFHSIPVFEDAKRLKRTVADKEFYMFYNPMWNFFGDNTQPYGTYYYDGSSFANTYWHIYDQVIIRPALRNRFIDDSLKIVTGTQSVCLLDNKGHPDNNISDHLPIIFEIKEKQL